jgi:hypothetical protein
MLAFLGQEIIVLSSLACIVLLVGAIASFAES